jgi:hypothetical protein
LNDPVNTAPDLVEKIVENEYVEQTESLQISTETEVQPVDPSAKSNLEILPLDAIPKDIQAQPSLEVEAPISEPSSPTKTPAHDDINKKKLSEAELSESKD